MVYIARAAKPKLSTASSTTPYSLVFYLGRPTDHDTLLSSRRTFWYKFREWGWPVRVNKAYSNKELIARVKELWEQNLKGTEMLPILNEEGYDINDRTLNRIRQKYGWKLRLKTIRDLRKGIIRPPGQPADGTNNGDNNNHDEDDSDSADDDDDDSDSEEVSSEEDEDEEEENAAEGNGQGSSNTHGQHQHQQQHQDQHQRSGSGSLPLGPDAELTPEQRARREERRRVLEQESAERWALKKRRRRIKGWAGLPADPSGLPPRFPSETTLDEAKVILQLDAATYKALRENFEKICRENNVIKKTIAGPEKWEALKEQMIRDSMHLRAIMWDQANMEQKKIAIDVICCDVTKRIRTMQSHMTLAQARTILGLNPEQGRYIRGTLYLLLGQEKFGFKYVEGIDKWNEMVQKWFDTTELLQELFPPGCEHWPNAKERKRAIELLARDGMRRYRGDQAKLEKDPNALDPKPPRKRAPPKPKPGPTPAQLEWAAKRAEKAAEKAAKAAQPKPGPGRPPKNNTAGPLMATATAPHTAVRLAPVDLSSSSESSSESPSEESEAEQDVQMVDDGDLDPDILLQQSIEADNKFGSHSANTPAASGRGGGANVGASTLNAHASSHNPNLTQTRSRAKTRSQAKSRPQTTQNYTPSRIQMQQGYNSTLNQGLTQSYTQPQSTSAMYTQQQQQQQQLRLQQQAIQQQARARQQHFQQTQTPSVPTQVQVSQPVTTTSSRQQHLQSQTPSVPTQVQVSQPMARNISSTSASTSSSSMAVYFRLHDSSPLRGVVSRMWIATLSGRSVQELRSTAVANYPGVVCLAIEGIVKDGKGGELPLPVSDDMEMEAYLQHIQGMGSGAPTFSVMLVPAAAAAVVGGSW